MKTEREIAHENRCCEWRPHRVQTCDFIVEHQYRDIEPGIRDVVRFLIESKVKTVFSCGGHTDGGRPWVPYTWGGVVDSFINGNPYVIVALGRKNEDYRWSHGAGVVFSLLMHGFGPLKATLLAKVLQSNSSIRKVFPSERYFLLIVFQGRAAARMKP